MHQMLSVRALPRSTTAMILAESQDVVLNSKNSKSDGYGALLSIGLILIAVIITILFFFRSRRGQNTGSRQSVDHQQDALGEPDDHDLKMK